MSYYQFSRREILQKAKERYSKKEVTTYCSKNKKAIKERSKNRYKNLSKEEKYKIKKYQRKRYQQLIQCKKEALNEFFLLSIRMSEKTLKFDNIRVNKKEFNKSKQPMSLYLVNVFEIVIMMMILNFLLVTKKVSLLNHYALSYLE